MKMTATLRHSEVPLKGKNETFVKILGGGSRQHMTTHAGQILGGYDPCNPCGVDAYADRAVVGGTSEGQRRTVHSG